MDRSDLQPKIFLDNFQNVLTSELSLLRLFITLNSIFAVFASTCAILEFSLSAIDRVLLNFLKKTRNVPHSTSMAYHLFVM